MILSVDIIDWNHLFSHKEIDSTVNISNETVNNIIEYRYTCTKM